MRFRPKGAPVLSKTDPTFPPSSSNPEVCSLNTSTEMRIPRMPVRIHIALFSLSVLLVLSVGCDDSPPGPPGGGLDTTSHAITWRTDTLGFFSSRLSDVWGTSPSNVYAVGLLLPEGTEPNSFIIRFDGVRWATLRDDSLSWWVGAGVLAGIHGLSDSAIYVVGSRYNGPPATGLVARWDGRRWWNISPDSSVPLLSVWVRTAEDVYACGANGTILRYDGTRWVKLESGTDLDVWSIVGLPGGELYAVAADYFNSYLGSLVLRIEGNDVAVDQAFGVGQKFDVWGATEDALYAVGEGTFKKTTSAGWKEVTTPNPSVRINSVSGAGPSDIIVAGAYGAVAHWNGATWRFYDELFFPSSSRSYFESFAIGGSYFLVGYTGTCALITVGTR